MKINKILVNNVVPKMVIARRIPHSPSTSIETKEIEYDIGEDEVLFEGDDDFIDTKVNLFDGDNNWTLLIDFTDLGNTTAVNSQFILHNFYEGVDEKNGFNIQKTGSVQGNVLGFQVNDNWYKTKVLENGVNTRLVIRYTAPNTLEMFYDDNDMYSYLGSSSYFKFAYESELVMGCTLHLACWYNESEGGVGRFWRGEINEFVVWNNIALSDEQISFILANKKYN